MRRLEFDTTIPVRVKATAFPFRKGSATEPDTPAHASIDEIFVGGARYEEIYRELAAEALEHAEEEQQADADRATDSAVTARKEEG